MSSPIAHVLGAMTAYRTLSPLTPGDAPQGRKALFLVGVLALVPDLDIAWGWIQGSGTIFHRGFTHSVLFALILAVLGNIIWYKSPEAFRKVGPMQVLLVACLVHPLLDYLMACGAGVPLLAPFEWHGFLADNQYVPTAFYAERFSDIPYVLTNQKALLGSAAEVWIFLPFFLASKPGRSWMFRLPMLLLGASGLVAMYFIYN